jgi:predicted adenine nucleotide alpha hydrolase (AANH) superfamily ATPase
MKILLHTCCAPCLIWPLEALKAKGLQLSGFFYNPNIAPFSEYAQRRQAVVDLAKTAHIEVFYPEYLPEEFQEAIKGNDTKPGRCLICWSLRLQKTALTAKEKGFDSFSTTLLVSPHQDHEALKKSGQDAAAVAGIEFYYEDFRPGYKKAHDQARQQGIYCQKYCGCSFSQCRK